VKVAALFQFDSPSKRSPPPSQSLRYLYLPNRESTSGAGGRCVLFPGPEAHVSTAPPFNPARHRRQHAGTEERKEPERIKKPSRKDFPLDHR